MLETLNARELMRLAILGEKTSYALYSRAAAAAESPEVKRILNRLARDELGHLFALLQKLGRLYPDLVEQIDITMPHPDDTQVWELAGMGSVQAIIEWAVKEEQDSVLRYSHLLSIVMEGEAREIVRAMIQEETRHVKALHALQDKSAETLSGVLEEGEVH